MPRCREDRPEDQLTPVHVAARMGHARVVEVGGQLVAVVDGQVLIDTGAHYARGLSRHQASKLRIRGSSYGRVALHPYGMCPG